MHTVLLYCISSWLIYHFKNPAQYMAVYLFYWTIIRNLSWPDTTLRLTVVILKVPPSIRIGFIQIFSISGSCSL